MSSLPITDEDFRWIGERFLSEDIVIEIDRLLPIAREDAAALEEQEYDADDLKQLVAFRARLTGESAARRRRRGEKKGSRRTELDAVVKGKQILQSGFSVALAAVGKRVPPPGETPETTQQIADSFAAQVNDLRGQIGSDSAKLRTVLSSLAAILSAPELSPRKSAVKSRAARLKKIERAIANLPSLSETKKGLQARAKGDTAALDVIDGRAYTNLKQLCSAGRTFFREAGNPKRAALYTLDALHQATRRRETGAVTPVTAKYRRVRRKSRNR